MGAPVSTGSVHKLSEVMEATEKGRHHARELLAGNRAALMPPETIGMGKTLIRYFAKGALEILDAYKGKTS